MRGTDEMVISENAGRSAQPSRRYDGAPFHNRIVEKWPTINPERVRGSPDRRFARAET